LAPSSSSTSSSSSRSAISISNQSIAKQQTDAVVIAKKTISDDLDEEALEERLAQLDEEAKMVQEQLKILGVKSASKPFPLLDNEPSKSPLQGVSGGQYPPWLSPIAIQGTCLRHIPRSKAMVKSCS
jgi:hypothetical protein